jgi:hypothetical protein
MKVKHPNFLNVFNIEKANQMVSNCSDYVELDGDYLLATAWDNTVWAVHNPNNGVCMREYKLVQRIV